MRNLRSFTLNFGFKLNFVPWDAFIKAEFLLSSVRLLSLLISSLWTFFFEEALWNVFRRNVTFPRCVANEVYTDFVLNNYMSFYFAVWVVSLVPLNIPNYNWLCIQFSLFLSNVDCWLYTFCTKKFATSTIYRWFDCGHVSHLLVSDADSRHWFYIGTLNMVQ